MFLIINVNIIGKDKLKEYILRNKKEINGKNEKGWTALHIATRNSKKINIVDIVNLLIENGANINLQNENGWTALMLASGYSNTDSNIETVKLLLEMELILIYKMKMDGLL